LLAGARAKSSLKGERRSKRAANRSSSRLPELRRRRRFPLSGLEPLRPARRLFLKLYEEERELPVTIFLDASESMTFGEPRKFDFARQVAAAVGYVALCGLIASAW